MFIITYMQLQHFRFVIKNISSHCLSSSKISFIPFLIFFYHIDGDGKRGALAIL